MLTMNSLYREWLSYLLESSSTVLDFLSWTKDEVIWTQSWSIHRVLLRQDTYWLSSNSRPSCSLSQPRIWTSTPTQTCSTPIITERKYDHRCIAEDFIGTNHNTERALIHLYFRLRCVGQQLTLGHKHCEVFLFSRVRDEHTLNKSNDLI